ncbi:MAG: rhomboid family intramembrane serine protease [Desulfobulbaceae bacterium]|nr:rhomboid family intramembrane serine protease [Desulfobulbaceae bacterium]
MNDLKDEYVNLRTTHSRYQAELWSLVLLSAGIAHVTEHRAPDYEVMVDGAQSKRAELEIASFERENRNWPPPKNLGVAVDTAERPPTVLLVGSLMIFHLVTGPFASGSEWFRLGAVDSRAILEGGEWWRLITALTLHADPVHLLGNIFIGGLVIHFLCQMVGTGRGWFMLMLAGTVANLANVMARGPGHISVGFSTAVFAAVGLLCGGQMKLMNLRSVLLPLGAGVALLAMLGSSGQRTDLGAHLWGLVVGLLLGVAWRWSHNNWHLGCRWGKQTYLLAVTILAVWLAWLKALAV